MAPPPTSSQKRVQDYLPPAEAPAETKLLHGYPCTHPQESRTTYLPPEYQQRLNCCMTPPLPQRVQDYLPPSEVQVETNLLHAPPPHPPPVKESRTTYPPPKCVQRPNHCMAFQLTSGEKIWDLGLLPFFQSASRD